MPDPAVVGDDERFRRSYQGAVTIAATLCVALAIVLLIYPLLRATYFVEINPNEGWNATHALRAMAGLNIYANDDTFLFNNYPPLSFYVVGGLGRIFGDETFLFTGRAISFAALVVTGLGVAWIVWHLVRSRLLSVFALAYAVCLLVYFHETYTAMNDPQMLAHAVMTIALALFVRGRNRTSVLVAVAILVCVAGLIKHNLLAVPIAITLYLLIYDRRGLAVWLGAAASVLVVALSVSYAIFGADFFDSVLARRPLHPDSIVRPGIKVLGLLVPTLVVWTAALYRKGWTRDDVLIGLYIGAAVLVGTVLAAGAGVEGNVYFDVLIAIPIALCLALDRLQRRLVKNRRSLNVRRGIAASMVLLALVPATYIAARRIPVIPYKIDRLDTLAEALAEDVAFLRAHPGRWACQRMLVCVVAGAPSEIDFINGRWALLLGRRDDGDLIENLRDRAYAVVQINHGRKVGTILTPTADFTEALLANYELGRRRGSRNFYVPK